MPIDAVDKAGFIPNLRLEEDQLELNFMAHCEILRLFFFYGGYPHEQLAFGYSWLLMSKPTPSKRGIEGKPSKVLSQYGETPIEQLIDQFEVDYLKKAGIRDAGTADFVRQALDPLRQRSELTVG